MTWWFLILKPAWFDLVSFVNSFRPRQMADDIFNPIFVNENVWTPIKFSLKFVPKGRINNIPTLVQIMAWRRLGDKPLSEPMMVHLLTHICVTRLQWVNVGFSPVLSRIQFSPTTTCPIRCYQVGVVLKESTDNSSRLDNQFKPLLRWVPFREHQDIFVIVVIFITLWCRCYAPPCKRYHKNYWWLQMFWRQINSMPSVTTMLTYRSVYMSIFRKII